MNLSTHCEGDTPPHPHPACLYNPFSLTSSAKKNNQDSNIQMFDSIKHYAPVFLFILYMAIHGKIWYQKLLNSKLETPQRSLLDNKLWEPGFLKGCCDLRHSKVMKQDHCSISFCPAHWLHSAQWINDYRLISSVTWEKECWNFPHHFLTSSSTTPVLGNFDFLDWLDGTMGKGAYCQNW